MCETFWKALVLLLCVVKQQQQQQQTQKRRFDIANSSPGCTLVSFGQLTTYL